MEFHGMSTKRVIHNYTCARTGKRPVSITLLEEPHGLLKTTTQMNANVCGTVSCRRANVCGI